MNPYRLFAIAAAGVVVYVFSTTTLATKEADLRNAVNVIAGTSATLLGFLVSAGALLYAVANTTLARNLQRTGHFQGLLDDLFVDATAFLAALLVGLTCLFLPDLAFPGSSATRLNVGIYVLVFANALAYLLLIPVGRKLWLLLSNIRPDSQPLE